MTVPITEKRFHKPCKECGGIIFYKLQGSCVKCTRREASIRATKTMDGTREFHDHYSPQDTRSEKFLAKEARIMANVNYRLCRTEK